MAFIYFKKQIGYVGQDLHIIRNNQQFPLHSFFDFPTGATVFYNFKFPGTGSTRSYEKINISVSGNEAFITADLYNGTTDTRINNFYVTINVENYSVTILIHLHDSISNLWLTPNPLTFRKNQQVQFGLYAKFSENVVGDISFYPGLEYSKIDAALTAVKVDSTKRLIIDDPNGTFPSILPSDHPNSFQVSLPAYFQGIGPTTANGSLQIRTAGNMQLIVGEKETSSAGNYDEKINILFLADGFNGGAKSNEATFTKYIRKIREQMLSTKSSPWNLFSDRLNFWSYYEESREGGGILGGEYLVLDEDTVEAKTISLNKFIDVCDGIILNMFEPKKYADGTTLNLEDYIAQVISGTYGSAFADYLPWNHFGNATTFRTKTFPLLTLPSGDPGVLTLNQLCYVVGLPGVTDVGKDLPTKKTEWANLGLLNTPYSIKIQGESMSASDLYLHEFTFKLWLKLFPRTVLDMPDTSVGTYRQYEERRPGDGFVTGPTLGFGVTKFPDWDQFGKYISSLKFPNTSSGDPIGLQFYDSNGMPTFLPDDDIEVNGNQTTKIKQLKDGNNVIVLSRAQKLGIGGINLSSTFSSTLGTLKTTYTKHRVIVSMYEEKFIETVCTIVPADNTILKPKSFKPKNITINKLGQGVKNAVIHELSHNYLLDEYAGSENDLNQKSSDIKNQETEYVRDSNLQTEWDLLDAQNTGGVIMGNKIKWLYPRIIKIGVSSKDLEEDSPDFKFELTKEIEFIQGEHVLLRRKKLFGAQYFHCTISSVDPNNKKLVRIAPISGVTINTSDFKKGSVLILPLWTDTNFTAFRELVHPKIKDRITALHAALVPKDLSPRRFEIQEPVVINSIPDMSADPVKAFKKNKSRIVGLFAGGTGKFSGYTKGLYHPTGFCIMRATDISDANYFCHVCRYIIVDAIDPLQHPVIDTEYGKSDYPEIN